MLETAVTTLLSSLDSFEEPWQPLTAAELGALLPQYQIESLIGRGGMGAVYKGRQRALGRPVAIKLLPEALGRSGDFASRFAREAQLLASLSHPGILSIYDFGQTALGHSYFVMEYVAGTDLHAMMRAQRLSPAQAYALFVQICQAVQYAHEMGVIHRDIKPSNILLTPEGRVKLADFGLAMSTQETGVQGSSDVIVGTPDYMAPERFSGISDHRADIYALGILFYSMLTGQMPRGSFEPPSTAAGVDKRADALVSRAIEADPAQRYQRVSEMLSVLSAMADAFQGPSTPFALPARQPGRDPAPTVEVDQFSRISLASEATILRFPARPLEVESFAATAPVRPGTPSAGTAPKADSESLFDRARHELMQGDLQAAIDLVAAAAAARHPVAQRLLISVQEIEEDVEAGLVDRLDQMPALVTDACARELYARGRKEEQAGSTASLVLALKCYRQAAELDHPKALTRLGLLHLHGRGVVRDFVTAAAFFSRAAAQQHGPALLQLGRLYERGTGIRRDARKALELYQQALAAGEEFAEDRIAAMQGGGGKAGTRKETAPPTAASSTPPPPAASPKSNGDQVFISYKREDHQLIAPVVSGLRDRGFLIWIDLEGIDAGTKWPEVIPPAIAASKVVVTFVSARALESDGVQRELNVAVSRKKHILPAMLEDIEIPVRFDYHFAGMQYLRLYAMSPAEQISELARALQRLGVAPRPERA